MAEHINKTLRKNGINDFSGYRGPGSKMESEHRSEDRVVGGAAIFAGMILLASSLINNVDNVSKIKDGIKDGFDKASYGFIKKQDKTIERDGLKEHVNDAVNEISKEWRISREASEDIVSIVMKESKQQGLDPHLVLAVIAKESSFNKSAKSIVGAGGLMQVHYKWHKDKIDRHDLFDPAKNISAGTKILKEYIKKEKGDIRRGLQRYNGSQLDANMKYSNAVMSFYDNFNQKLSLADLNGEEVGAALHARPSISLKM